MFHRFFDDGSGRNSYVLACPRAREAVLVDPRRDVDVYVALARSLDLRIAYAFETHLHADVATGSRELLALGTRVIAGPGANLRYAHHQAAHGERLRVGDLSILFLHTPGHTPEHISILASQPDQPVRLFTGDTLLVGGPGRPEPVDDDEARRLAGALHDSLFGKILVLDDRIEVRPGATAASANDADPVPFTTIGREKRCSPLLQQATREGFVAAILSGVAAARASWLQMKAANREGPPFLGLVNGYRGPSGISAGAAARAVRAGGIVVDLRGPAEFAAGHPRGAINLQPGPGAGSRAASLLPHDPRVVLLAADRIEAMHTARQLLRIGVSRMDGFINGGFAAWRAAGLPTSERPSVLSV